MTKSVHFEDGGLHVERDEQGNTHVRFDGGHGHGYPHSNYYHHHTHRSYLNGRIIELDGAAAAVPMLGALGGMVLGAVAGWQAAYFTGESLPAPQAMQTALEIVLGTVTVPTGFALGAAGGGVAGLGVVIAAKAVRDCIYSSLDKMLRR